MSCSILAASVLLFFSDGITRPSDCDGGRCIFRDLTLMDDSSGDFSKELVNAGVLTSGDFSKISANIACEIQRLLSRYLSI